MSMLLRRHRENQKSSDQSKTTKKATSQKEDNDGKTRTKQKKGNK